MTSSPMLFVTGTDTDVGKTVVAAALVKGMKHLGQKADYWKPIQAGLVQRDRDFVQGVTEQDPLASTLEISLAASPDQGLEKEGITGLTAEELANRLPKADGLLVIEGAGGLLVPVNTSGETWVNVLKHWRCPVLVVARTGLGTLNHTTLTIRHLQDTGANIAGVILSGERHSANEASLRRLNPGVALHHFPCQSEASNPDRKDCENLAEFVSQMIQIKKETWLEQDVCHVWHPYTQHKGAAKPSGLIGANGPWLHTATGEKLIDASSSWWVNTVGHGREEIRKAISRQQAQMDHVIFANATHKPGSELAARLASLTQGQLPKVFYSDNGSTAVEVGFKMAFQAWRHRGETKRTKFLALQASYHGDTIGTMAVGNATGFHQAFAPLMFATHHIAPVTSHPSSPCPEGPVSVDQALAELDQHLRQHHHEYAAFVLEPLLQGAGGMLMQDMCWLQEAVQLCRSHGIYIVLDEVFTGMGRVGEAFAYQRADLSPDIVCLAKGLTGGTMPLAATLATEEVYTAFLSDDRAKAFLHGHSYTGNPIACAAALATLDIFTQENLPGRARQLEKAFHQWWQEHHASLPVKHGRTLGGVLAMELAGKDSFNQYFDPRAAKIPELARRHGLFLRPLGNTVYLVLPLTISDADLQFTLAALTATLREFC